MFSFFKKKKIIAHIKLNGVIGNAGKFKQGIDFAGQEEIIEKAFSLKKAKAVAITINSPGGSPVQSHLIYKFIRAQAKKNKIKVIVFAEDVAASGGYLIACAGDEIYANSSSIIGSIGVIYSSFGFKDLIKKVGVDRRVYTAGKNKSTLDPFLEEKKEDSFLFSLLGYHTNKDLYKTAFIHKSFNHTTHNEQLEFLGDAVLSSIVAEFLFLENPKKEEGFLSQKRAIIVGRKHLNLVGKKIIPPDEIKSKLKKIPLL